MFLAIVVAAALFGGSLVCLEIGRRLGADDTPGQGGTAVLEAAMFALMGLVIAFSFSRAAIQFDGRRQLIIDETNNIGTAWLRIDLLPAETQPQLRTLFRDYLDARLVSYASIEDRDLTRARIAHASAIQLQIWTRAVAACQEAHEPATTTLVLSSLNTMFDIASTRIAVTGIHTPTIVFVMLGMLALLCSLLAGRSMPHRKLLHSMSWSVIVAVTVYVILDLEYPRLGFINVDSFDRLLVQLRQTMNA